VTAMNGRYDVIIIGSGAGGGTLAFELAPTGKKILIVERGGYVPREPENWSTEAVVQHDRYHTKEAWRDGAGREFHPATNYYVGGNTKFYGAALFRMREEDFGEVKHHGGVSPAWPIAYADLEPYYAQAEALYQVHGQRGADPTEPWASGPYPHPPVSHEPRIQRLVNDLTRIGSKPFPVPLAVQMDERRPNLSKCVRCATCDGHPCWINAKSDAQVVCVDPALEHPNVSLLTEAYVERLTTDASGRTVTGVVVKRGGETETYAADVVVVSAGAINSAALLLRSANDRHPKGLANASDQVGRNYMAHLNTVLLALSKTPNPTVFQKTMAMNDFYRAGPDWEFPMGHISFVGKFDRHILAAGAPPIVPGFTLEQMAKHSLDFWLTSEDLPAPDNRVTVDPDGAIRLSYTANNLEGHQRLQGKLKDMLEHLDCHPHLVPRGAYIGKRIPIAGVAHQNGTLRFGRDARTSVLDPNCRAHEVDNLYVVDGSFFPSSGAVNPALTIMANALRVGAHLKERLS
jgi:choline dehydrogenase-like flavoprotein